MAEDDCENKWGRNLLPSSSSLSRQNIRNDQMNAEEKHEFCSILSTFGIAPFTFYWDSLSLTQNGLTANVSAILEACEGNCDKCLCAYGCYVVGGDIANMQCRSVVQYWPSSGNPIPNFRKINECEQKCIETIVILPYYVDDFDGREQHEWNCLKFLHEKIITGKISGNEYKCILLELVLACNGACLSDSFLVNFSHLMKHHGIKVIVDEVLTAGRCGGFLFTTTKPKEFQDIVSHVTIGKWTECGIVLRNSEIFKNRNITSNYRGYTTTYPGRKAFQVIKQYSRLVNTVDVNQIRLKVIKKLKCVESDCWGMGCLLFAPVVMKAMYGIGNRYLPLLDQNIKVNPRLKNFKKSILKSEYNKTLIHQQKEWMKDDCHHSWSILNWTVSKIILYDLLNNQYNKMNVCERVKQKVKENSHSQNLNADETVTHLLNNAISLNLVAFKHSGKKRKCCLFLNDKENVSAIFSDI